LEKRTPRRSRKATPSLAAKAAELMGIQTLRVESDEHRALAAKIPRGKIFASGRAFVPLIRAALYDQLVAAAGRTPTQPPSLDRKRDLAAQWDDIDVGSWVLTCTNWREGWWEAHVLEVKGDLLKLKFRHWPDVPPFSQRRTQVALLHPKARRAAASGRRPRFHFPPPAGELCHAPR
jgi:hypothetical protein